MAKKSDPNTSYDPIRDIVEVATGKRPSRQAAQMIARQVTLEKAHEVYNGLPAPNRQTPQQKDELFGLDVDQQVTVFKSLVAGTASGLLRRAKMTERQQEVQKAVDEEVIEELGLDGGAS